MAFDSSCSHALTITPDSFLPSTSALLLPDNLRLISSFQILQKNPRYVACPPAPGGLSHHHHHHPTPSHGTWTFEQHLLICIVYSLPSVYSAAIKVPRGQGPCFSFQMYG